MLQSFFIFDEPTIGLDILTKEKIINIIKEMNQECKTSIILTTHDLNDVEKLCKRVLIIDKGNAIYDGTIDNLKTVFDTVTTVQVETSTLIGNINNIINESELSASIVENRISVQYDQNRIKTTEVINTIMSRVPEIKDISIIETRIDDIVKKIYSK